MEKIENWTYTWGLLASIENMLLLIFTSIIIASLLKLVCPFMLRFLEGQYWFGKKYIISMENHRIEKAETRRQELATKPHLGPDEDKELAKLDKKLMYVPPLAKRMPTRLGNLLRAIEMRPYQKYGLNLFVCWPRLWLLLPDNAKQEVDKARHNLDATVHVWTLCVLFAFLSLCGGEALLTIPIVVVASLTYYFWMLPAARIYGVMVESCFDLYRSLLYQASRFPIPDDSATEPAQGRQLTAHLWGRFVPVKFVNN